MVVETGYKLKLATCEEPPGGRGRVNMAWFRGVPLLGLPLVGRDPAAVERDG